MSERKDPAQRTRRNRTIPMTMLPRSGRVGPLPSWPLSRASAPEKKLWSALWAMPQAMVWESQRLERIVARYCRLTIEAEQPNASTACRGEARQMEDKLLLNPEKLKRAFYEIAGDEVGAKRDEPVPASSSATRLRAVDTSAVAGA